MNRRGAAGVLARHKRRALPWIGIGGAVTRSPPSRPGELHPEPLTDPDVNLSIHPAGATQEGCRLPARQGVPPVAR